MSQIDKEVLETMQKEQIELGLSNEQQFRRCELNFYAELLSLIKDTNKRLESLVSLVSTIGTDKLTEYFTEISNNYKKEETKAKLQKKLRQSHKSAKVTKS